MPNLKDMQQRSKKTFIGNDWEFTFGKYKGKDAYYVLTVNPGYLLWVADNVEWAEVDPKLIKVAKSSKHEDMIHRSLRGCYHNHPYDDHDDDIYDSVPHWGDLEMW